MIVSGPAASSPTAGFAPGAAPAGTRSCERAAIDQVAARSSVQIKSRNECQGRFVDRRVRIRATTSIPENRETPNRTNLAPEHRRIVTRTGRAGRAVHGRNSRIPGQNRRRIRFRRLERRHEERLPVRIAANAKTGEASVPRPLKFRPEAYCSMMSFSFASARALTFPSYCLVSS